MPKIPLSIAGGFYQSRSLPFIDQRCVGWYPSYAETEALSEAAVFGAPGIELLTQAPLATEVNRGMTVVDGTPYIVKGTSLYRLDRVFNPSGTESFSLVSLGTIPGSGFVSMTDNGDQLCIVVPGVSGFVYTVSSLTLEQITDAGFTANGKSEFVVFIDGYFTHFAGKKIFHSLANDALSYNSLDVGSAQADPDSIVSIIVYKNQLFVFGSETIEVFGNAAKFPFTFQRIPGYFVPIGCFATFSPIAFNRGVAFIGGQTREKASVFWGPGQSFERISTTPIEQKIQEATDQELAQAYTWSYSEDGAIFLGLVVGKYCFVYDANASRLANKKIWHERQSTITERANTQVSWRVSGMVSAYGRIIVGDRLNGNIGSISLDVFDEYGTFISRKLSTKPLSNQSENLFIDEVELTMESGVTSDPDNVIKLSWSDDNKTFTDNLPADIGISGQYTLRQYWRRLGHAPRFRTFQFTYTGKDKSVLLKMEVNLDSSS